MKVNLKVTYRILWAIAIVIVVGGAVWSIFLNEAQRIVVGAGVVLGLLNLFFIGKFFQRNDPARRQTFRRR